MTMLARIAAVLERARIAGGWDDEAVARAVLVEMRVPTDEMVYAAANDAESRIGRHEALGLNHEAIWQVMIDAELGEPPE